MSQFIRPNWLGRNGTLVVCSILFMLLTCSWFIKYPESVNTQAVLTGTNAPKPIIVYQSGRLMNLLRRNGERVRKDEVIGCIETTADWREVLRLSDLMDTLSLACHLGDVDKIRELMSNQFNRLGELQNSYQAFVQSYLPYRDYVLGGYGKRKRKLLGTDISLILRSKEVLEEQKILYHEDLILSQTAVENNKKLLDDTIISAQEFREITSQNIGKRMTIPQIKTGYIGIEEQANSKQKEMLELENQINTSTSIFQSSMLNFMSALAQWKHLHLLIASVEGVLSFKSLYQEDQPVEAGNTFAYVIPFNSRYYLQAIIPQDNTGKVKVGQKVLLRFKAWQWQEYGYVTGQIDFISSISSDSGYLAKIILPEGLVTTNKKALDYKEGLAADAEIIIKPMSLGKRFYYDMIKNIKGNK